MANLYTGNARAVTSVNDKVGEVELDAADVGAEEADADLAAIAGLTPTDGDMMRRESGVWVARSMAQIKTALALTKADVGLALADNTADTAKPVSTAQQTALDLKANTADAVLKSLATTKGDLIVATAASTPARLGVGTDGYQLWADPSAASGMAWRPADPYGLTSGTTTIPRHLAGSNTAISLGASGTLRLVYFQAPRTETITQLAVVTGTTGAGATPTLVRWCVLFVAANGDLTLAGAIANDITALAAPSTRYLRSLTSSYGSVAGNWYAFGIMVVTGAALPTLAGISLNAATAQATAAPRISGQLAGQTDLPASILAGSVAASNALILGEVLPA